MTGRRQGGEEDALTRHLRLEGEVCAYNAARAQDGERPITAAEYKARFDPDQLWALRIEDTRATRPEENK